MKCAGTALIRTLIIRLLVNSTLNLPFRFPCYATALVLVHCGASVVAVDSARNTPLHILVTKVNTIQDRQAEMARILQLFVQAGAHLDAVNAAGQTAASACKQRKWMEIIFCI